MSQGDQLLSDLWYKLSSPGSFAGRDVLLKTAQRIDPTITLRRVKLFLNKQAPYLRHRRPRKRRGKQIQFNKYVSTGPNLSFSCDTALFRHTKLPHLVVCRDSFSDKIFGKTQRGLKAKTTLKTMRSIIENQNKNIWPHTLYTDLVMLNYDIFMTTHMFDDHDFRYRIRIVERKRTLDT